MNARLTLARKSLKNNLRKVLRWGFMAEFFKGTHRNWTLWAIKKNIAWKFHRSGLIADYRKVGILLLWELSWWLWMGTKLIKLWLSKDFSLCVSLKSSEFSAPIVQEFGLKIIFNGKCSFLTVKFLNFFAVGLE